jgi:hypothetical protein
MKTDLTVQDFRTMKKFNPKAKANKETLHKPVTGFGNEKDITQNRRDLERYANMWNDLKTVRTNIRKNREFANGKQWNEVVLNPETNTYMTEENYIKYKGRVPRVQNVIKPIINNIIGQYLNGDTNVMVVSRTKDAPEEEEAMSNAVQAVHQINRTKLLDSRLLEVFLHGGLIAQRLRFKFIKSIDETDIEIENCNINRMFFNGDISDPRMNDLRTIGYLHDMTLEQVTNNYATKKEDEEKIKSWYRGISEDYNYGQRSLTSDEVDSLNFTIAPIYKCRVIEVWEKKYVWQLHVWDEAEGYPEEISGISLDDIKKLNADRLKKGKEAGMMEDEIPLIKAEHVKNDIWHGRFLTPDGYVLWEGDSPYEHGEHPFILMAYPLIDGEVRGMVEDLKSSQRGINRNMNMMDHIISVSAKGVLLLPRTALEGTNLTEKEYADLWAQPDGVIAYTPKAGVEPPQQISANAVNVGLQDLLARDIQFMQDISGIHSAIQGKAPKAGTPSSLYAQEAQNASLNILNYLTTFDQFLEMRDVKIMKMIKQYYTNRKYIVLSGKTIGSKIVKWNSDEIRKLEYQLIRTKGQNTPAYKMVMDERLSMMADKDQISVKQYLQMSGYSFAPKLLQIIEQDEQKAIDAQAGIGNVQGNPEAMKMLAGQQQQAA